MSLVGVHHCSPEKSAPGKGDGLNLERNHGFSFHVLTNFGGDANKTVVNNGINYQPQLDSRISAINSVSFRIFETLDVNEFPMRKLTLFNGCLTPPPPAFSKDFQAHSLAKCFEVLT